ncbi:hypothetical protein ACROYT_G040645 [Oculina patagonica]
MSTWIETDGFGRQGDEVGLSVLEKKGTERRTNRLRKLSAEQNHNKVCSAQLGMYVLLYFSGVQCATRYVCLVVFFRSRDVDLAEPSIRRMILSREKTLSQLNSSRFYPNCNLSGINTCCWVMGVRKFLSHVQCGDLEYLIIDTSPGI